jgi:uncharacterized damage-inducible protein DinB
MIRSTFPGRTEAADSYFRYIDQVDRGDICATLDAQIPETFALLDRVSEEKSLHRYAPDKWSIRQVLNHISDTERVFAFRAWWFARGFASPLPDFDQNIAIAASDADARSLNSHLEEFRVVREGTLTIFRCLSDSAWMSRGVASGNTFTAHALAFITAGHVVHHLKILRERYL